MSARERFLKRGLPTAIFPLAAAPSHEVEAAAAAVDEARRAFLAAEQRGDDVTPYRATLDEAQAVLDSCYEDATVRALPSELMEDLLTDHAPSAEQAKDGLAWDPETFVPALLAEAVRFAEGETWTVEEWTEAIVGGLSLGEVSGLFDAAYSLNGRTLDLRVGKELRGTPSSL